MKIDKIRMLFVKSINILVFLMFLLISLTSFMVIKTLAFNSTEITREVMYDNWLTNDIFEIEDAPKHLKNAVVAIEDERFYKHKGIDIIGLTRSLVNNIIKGTRHGGSTINMQLSKNLLTTSEQTIERKIKDIYYAVQIDKVLTKDEILEIYLNNIYLARGPYGIKSAAKEFFDKEVEDLTLSDCATLVGITKNPAKYSKDMEALTDRRNTVLYKMYELGYISNLEYNEALNTVIIFVNN